VDRFASRVFSVAGIYGLITLIPQYFMEGMIAELAPPAITHPEYFYGFLGVTIAWQLCFLIIARDPVRLRPVMLAAIVEKLVFAIPAIILYAQLRLAGTTLIFVAIDLVLAVLFTIAFRRTPLEHAASSTARSYR
jgi:hypothetical protein